MPVNPTFPGVYIEEVPSGVHPIEGVSTSITAFLGSARRGPLHKPRRILSFSEYERTFGGLIASSQMSYAVKQFFANGGTQAWVVRVKKSGTASTGLRLKAADFTVLDAVKEIGLLCVPGVSGPGALAAADAYCKARRMFLIVDAPKPAKLPADMMSAVADLPKSESAAVYYPWINIADPLAGGNPRLSPPSGTIAGMYARIDASRGVWKAPAGTEATLAGVQSLGYTLTDAENGTLNSRGVNSLRTFPGIGTVAWGSRTLVVSEQANSEWKYVSVRRLFIFVEHSIDQGLQWVVFEPNGEPLWAKVREVATAFLDRLFHSGAFQGNSPKEAYFVKCDRATMTQNDIDNGRLICEIGIAPLKPAEFVIFRIQQMTKSSS